MLLAVAGTARWSWWWPPRIRAARRRLRYESWHLLHLYAYLGVGLALPHQLWTGTDFIGSPAATRLLVDGLRGGRRQRAGVPARAAAVAQRHGTGWGSHGWWPRRPAWSRSTCAAGGWTGCRSGPGSSSAGGSSPGRAGPGPTPTRCPRRPGPTCCASRSRSLGDGSSRARRLRPGTRVLIEGPYGRLTGAARRRSNHDAGLGDRHHPAARAAGGAAVPAGRGDAGLPRPYPRRLRLPLGARRAGRAPRGPGRVPPRAARGRRRLGPGRLRPGRPAAAPDRAGSGQTTTSTSAGRTAGWRRPREAARRVGVPAEHVHIESFSW